MFLHDPETATNVRQAVTNVRDASSGLNHAAGQADLLVSDLQSRQLGVKVDQTMATVQNAATNLDMTSQQVRQTVSGPSRATRTKTFAWSPTCPPGSFIYPPPYGWLSMKGDTTPRKLNGILPHRKAVHQAIWAAVGKSGHPCAVSIGHGAMDSRNNLSGSKHKPTHNAVASGAQTRSVSLIVKNADDVYVRAKSAGAEVVEPIEDKPFGGRGFACLDLEGHIWHVLTYDPWAPQ
ncbi:VOC family protein [Terriglobus tenax]|uniref:hypothetical protein n=1 Tax=Terriglobus tenax TaxID=1111115 RepID=UPI0021DF46E4|nr:hypothetical protein [Terriglobus tenax]